MRKILVLVIISLLTATITYAQTGKIAGKVLNEKNEPLSGVSIKIDNHAAGIATDVEGRFLLKLKPGKYTLTLTSVGYDDKTITDVQLDADGLQELNIVMQAKSKELKAVVVSVSAKRETDFALLNMQKNNASISDGISAETIKRSPDKNTGEVLKRVSGTSIQDNKFVVVRGLIDRYNVATINNAMLPSTEPDRRAFSFDIIPSSLIDNIMIYKTANPDLPGDFAGGVVQVSTKDVPSKNFLSLGAGVSYNTISTGKDFNPGYVSQTDYLGFDDGSRKLPANFPSRSKFQGQDFEPRAEYSKLLKNTYGDRYNGNALPNQSYQLSWGKRFELKNSAVLGSILALTYRNSQTLVEGFRSEYDNQFTQVNGAAYNYNDTTYKFTTSIGALLNLSYKKGNTKISFKNLFNRLFENSNLIRRGVQYYSSNASVYAQGGETVVKTLYSTQLEGDHSLKNKSKLTWNVNYALTLRDNPDYKFAPFIKSEADANKNDVPYEVVLRDTYRFFANLEEHAVGGNVNYSRPFNLFGDKASTIKLGVLSQYKFREFSARIFRYNRAPGSNFNEGYLTMPVKYIFQDANMNKDGFALEEVTNTTDKYDANSMLNAGYVMFDNRLNEKFRLVWGLRVENFGFEVNTADFSGLKVKADKNYLDILPSLNLTYSLTSSSNLRFSASRTVSRPEFREIANFSFYDFVRNVQVRGNTKLERSQNTNIDLRYETYPSNGEVISASVFVKHFNKPIEQYVDAGSSSLNMVLSYFNAKYALNYGIEAEIKKRLSFLGKQSWLEDLFIFANAAIIKSNVNVDGLDIAVADKDRPMQGQSPYVINAGLTYAGSNNFSASLLVNRIGQRIEAVGNDPKGIPDIYENGRTIVDFQLSQKVLRKRGEIRLNISDLLNQKSVFYQNYRIDTDKISKRSYKSSEDRVWASSRFGTSLGLSFNYNF
ncbi:TonB-dependent receptor [Niastella caeni]|uniref:TonB-dependent receptor n=1 Tax=Niastella caeni TaxID=2569763 RepID=A0A4S8I2B1_9BACT|nr:TonB-dependent receptor [Niastella caeni]THU41419.1 TonB-dependent receptor [Niastella caeni]